MSARRSSRQLVDMGLADYVTMSHDFSLSYDDSP